MDAMFYINNSYEEIEHIDRMLRTQFPKHNRSSCNDQNFCNLARGCHRCFWLEIRAGYVQFPQGLLPVESLEYA